MKPALRKIKSKVPVLKDMVTGHHYHQAKQAISALEGRGEDWAREVRALRLEIQRIREYQKWIPMNYPTPKVVAEQAKAAAKFAYRPLISIVVPVYNTKVEYLEACLDSVLGQSYDNWQLCIVDDKSPSPETIECLRRYAKDNAKISLEFSKENGHISVTSNKAVALAKGEFVALLDHDDVLWPNALFEVVSLLQTHRDADFVYSDEDKIDGEGLVHFDPFFKPNWSPHLLECINYITHLSVIRTELVKSVGGFEKMLVGAQDWDLFLRISEKTNKIYHVPTILYSWRAHEQSTARSIETKDYAVKSQEEALLAHFERTKQSLRELSSPTVSGPWFPKFEVTGNPLVSIVIPTKDKVDYLERCVSTVFEKSTYHHFEVVIVDTGSKEPATEAYYEKLRSLYSKDQLRIVSFPKQPFNYSDACNYGAKKAKGKFLLMLNNDTEVITGEWIEDMLGYAQQSKVGAVGVKLLYPNKQIQHAGVAVGIASVEPVAGHLGIFTDYSHNDYLTRLYTDTVRDISAVTAACLMVSADKFEEVGGFDPIFRVTFNDVDLCLKIGKAGYNNIYLPYVELFHHESVSVGRVSGDRDMTELIASAKLIRKKWKQRIDHDPYYNPNFYILSSNFGLNVHPDPRELKKLKKTWPEQE